MHSFSWVAGSGSWSSLALRAYLQFLTFRCKTNRCPRTAEVQEFSACAPHIATHTHKHTRAQSSASLSVCPLSFQIRNAALPPKSSVDALHASAETQSPALCSSLFYHCPWCPRIISLPTAPSSSLSAWHCVGRLSA